MGVPGKKEDILLGIHDLLQRLIPVQIGGIFRPAFWPVGRQRSMTQQNPVFCAAVLQPGGQPFQLR